MLLIHVLISEERVVLRCSRKVTNIWTGARTALVTLREHRVKHQSGGGLRSANLGIFLNRICHRVLETTGR